MIDLKLFGAKAWGRLSLPGISAIAKATSLSKKPITDTTRGKTSKNRDQMNSTAKITASSNPRLKLVPAVKVESSPEPIGIVDQVTLALKPNTRVATFLGFLLGGFVPLASYVVAHFEIDRSEPFYTQSASLLVLGGLMFSAMTVYSWAQLAFKRAAKSVGFVVLLEGVMIMAHTEWLAWSALAYLVAVNGIATGCTLSLDRKRRGNK